MPAKKPKLPRQRIFDFILAQALRQGVAPQKAIEASKWMRNKAKQLGKNITPNSLMKETERNKSRQVIGKMYHFWYDAKHKKTLPYWDQFPLVFPIGPAEGGFLGINLHYLHPKLRAILMDALFDTLNNQRFNQNTKLQISYKILNKAAKFRWFKPCVKHYLFDHINSPFLQIEAIEWNIALFLPTEKFQKKSKEYVWKQSQKIIDSNTPTKSKSKSRKK